MATRDDVLALRKRVDAKEEEIRQLLESNGHDTKDPIVVMAMLVTVNTSLAFGALRMEEAMVQAKKILLGASTNEDFAVKES